MSTRRVPRRMFAAAAALAVAGGVLLIAPVAQADPAPARVAVPEGTITTDSAPSTAVSTGTVEFQVYLPAGYDPGDTGTRYPTLYLLHGRGDTDSAWTREKADLDRLIADGSVPPVIVVMPDAPWESAASWYVDSQYTGDGPAEQVETAITRDLVGYVDGHYRTVATRTARAVGGYSMGGYGALRYALAHQDEFSAAIVLSPAVFTTTVPDPDDIRDHGAFGVGDEPFVMDRYTALNYPTILNDFDPTMPVRMYLAVGDKEYAYPHPYEHNDLDFETAVAYNQLKRVDGITADMRVLGGGHDWDVWQPAFVEGLNLIGPVISPNAPQPMDATLFGGAGDDWAGGAVPTDDGGVTLAYATTGAVADAGNQGGLDVAVTHLGQDGTTTWATPIANEATQRAFGAAPGPDGVVYVGGYTGGDLDGQHSGNDGDDAFVSAIAADGRLLWTTQFGDGTAADRVYAVGADPAGGVFVAGYTKGSVQDGVANAGDKDVFVAHLAGSGAIDWIRQVGSAGEDKGFAVTAFDGGVAVAGVAGDAMPGAESAGGADGFVAVFDSSGASRWLRQIGSAESDLFSGLATGPDGTLIAVGQFAGDLGGASAGGLDALAVGYDASGTPVWISRWGTEGDDQAATVTVDPAGGYLVTGATNGAFTQTVGGFDIFASHLRSDGTVTATQAVAGTVADRARTVGRIASSAASAAADATAPEAGTIQFGTQHDDGVSQYAELNLYAAAAADRVWITGATFGSTATTANVGGADVFLTSLALPETGPGTSSGTAGSSTGSSTTPQGSTSSAAGSTVSTVGASSGPASGSETSSNTPESSAAKSPTSSTAGSFGSSAPAGGGQQSTGSSGAVIARPGSGGGLSYTGVAAIGLLVVALLLVGTGGVATVLSRRRPGSHAR